MVSKTQKFRLGIFIFISSILMILFIVLVAGNKLMEKRDNYYITYKDISVSGLQIGGKVKYHGIIIGRVDDIMIDKEDVRNIIAVISVKSGTPLKSDIEASLIPVGITGLVQIELIGGSNEADLLTPGSNITPGSSSFQNITGKAEVIGEKLELLLNNLAEITNKANQKKINRIISNIDNLIKENREEMNTILTNLDSTSTYLTELTKSTNETIENVNRILESEQLKNVLANSEKFSETLANIDLTKLIEQLNETVHQANVTFKHVDLTLLTSRQDILETIENLKETIDYLNDFSRQISENPSILLRAKKK